MEANRLLCAVLCSKLEEEATLARRLMEKLPRSAATWRPDWPAHPQPPFTAEELCWHLCDALSGFCAVLARLGAPDARAESLRHRVQNPAGSIAASMALLDDLLIYARDSFAPLDDSHLHRSIPSVFAPAGKYVLDLMLTNLTHFTNHKHQLFTYLKLLGVPAATADLYRFDAS